MTSILQIDQISVAAKSTPILHNISFAVAANSLTSLVGPSGVGKSTLLRCINRLIDEEDELSLSGDIRYQQKSIYHSGQSLANLRREIGIVFQKPVIFPISIIENLFFGLRHVRKIAESERAELAEKYLREAFLWDEVRSRLSEPALKLSIGQQQRLAIARTLALEPKVLLLDEPTASLDPKATAKIEDLILELKKTRALILVTHDHEQARRLSDQIIEFHNVGQGAIVKS